MSCEPQHEWSWCTPQEASAPKRGYLSQSNSDIVARPGQLASRRRVLIIEDCEDTANSFREVLELGGYHTEGAFNGPDGLAKARYFCPEVVLCDLGLPGMDGFAVARAFQADRALIGCVLIALSGYAQPEDVRRAMAAGFHRHVAKPTDVEVLYRVVAEVPRRRRR